jgi:hypothetical protein
LALINDSDKPLSVTLTPQQGETVKKTVPLQEIAYAYVPYGIYDIKIYDGERLHREFKKFPIQKINSVQESDYLWIDLAGKSTYIVANINFLYKGTTSLADALKAPYDKASGNLIERWHKSDQPFYEFPGILKPFEKFPERTDATQVVRALIPLQGEFDDRASIEAAVLKKILNQAP